MQSVTGGHLAFIDLSCRCALQAANRNCHHPPLRQATDLEQARFTEHVAAENIQPYCLRTVAHVPSDFEAAAAVSKAEPAVWARA